MSHICLGTVDLSYKSICVAKMRYLLDLLVVSFLTALSWATCALVQQAPEAPRREGMFILFPRGAGWAMGLLTFAPAILPVQRWGPPCQAAQSNTEDKIQWWVMLMVPPPLCLSPYPETPSHPAQKMHNSGNQCSHHSQAWVAISVWCGAGVELALAQCWW